VSARPLTEQNAKVLAFIRGREVFPTLQEIADAFGWASTRAAGHHVDALVATGHIERLGRGRYRVAPPPDGPVEGGVGGIPHTHTWLDRGPRLLPVARPDWPPVTVPDRGRVSCGAGVENDEEFPTAPLNVSDLFRQSDLVSFEATGTSMIDAHIAPGDRLFVRENPDPPVGSIVVVMLDREMLCKKLVKRTAHRVVLKPCNGEAREFDFDPRGKHFRVLGVLHSVLRTY